MAINLRDLVAKLRVVFDKRASDQAESQAKGSMARMRAAALKLGAALAAAFTVRALSRFAVDAVRTAAAADAIWNRLAGTLRTVGIEFKAVEGDIRAAARAMQDATTVGDEDFAAILTDLTSISRDYARSLNNVQVVADLAAAKQLDFRTAAQLVGRAMIGETALLKRYGIIVDEGADAVEAMRRQFDGMAANEAGTLQGKLKQLNNEWADFKEAVGAAMIEAGGGTSVLDLLIGAVKSMTAWVERNTDTLVKFVNYGITPVLRGVQALYDAVKGVAELFSGVLFGVLAAGARGLALVAEGAALAARAKEKFVGLWNDEKAAQFAEENRQLREQARALRDWAAAAEETARQSIRSAFTRPERTPAAERERTPTPLPPPPPPAGDDDDDDKKEKPYRRERGPGLQEARRQTQEAYMDVWGMELELEREFQRQREEAWLAHNEALIGAAYTVADGYAQAWEDAFARVIHEGGNAGDFLAELAKGMGRALLAGLSDYARGKTMENVAAAIEQTAKGFARAAVGDGAGAALHFKAASSHAASAAAWGAMSGAVAALSGGGGGGGGGRGSIGARDNGSNLSRGAQAPGPEVHIYIDPLSPDNPAFQRVVAGAEQNARERYGENARVYTHRRTGSQ